MYTRVCGAALVITALLAFPVWAAERPVLRIGYLPVTDHLLVIAKAREPLTGVDFQPVKFASWPELAEALKAGAVEGGFVLAPLGLMLRKKGVPLRAVLLGHRNGSVLAVRPDGDVHSVKDLAGKTVAIPSRFSTHNLLLRRVLAASGLTPGRDLSLIELAPPEMVNALATRRVDAFIVAEPFGVQAEAQHLGSVLMLSKEIWPDHISSVLNLRQEVIDAHPDAVQQLVTALVRTGHEITRDPHRAAADSRAFLGQRPELIERVLTTPPGRVTYERLTPTTADFQALQEGLVEYGIIRDRVDLTTYVDDRYAKTAGH